MVLLLLVVLLLLSCQNESKARSEQLQYLETLVSQSHADAVTQIATFQADLARANDANDDRVAAVEAFVAGALSSQEDVLTELAVRLDVAVADFRAAVAEVRAGGDGSGGGRDGGLTGGVGGGASDAVVTLSRRMDGLVLDVEAMVGGKTAEALAAVSARVDKEAQQREQVRRCVCVCVVVVSV